MGFKTFLTDHIPGYNKIVLPYHAVKAFAAATRYGYPAKKMTVIGVTGTNGKTSSCFMIWKMLNEAGYKTGLLTTVAWGGVPGMRGDTPDGLHKQIEHMTTADSMTLNKRIAEIRKAGAEFLVLEVTSHALAQHRIYGIPIEVAAMTNVTHEHLDYHKTFENYRDAKRKLFKRAKFGIVNADDKSATWFIEDTKGRYISYGIKSGQLRAREIEMKPTGVSYTTGGIKIKRSDKAVDVKDGTTYQTSEFKVKTQIPGEFNVYNSLLAAAVGLRLGLNETQIARGIYALESVEGRMNTVSCGQRFHVIVDYAHTPDAVQKVFDSVLPSKKAGTKIITVTGGAGRRDESQRGERGEICGKNSDIFIVTEDDSRDEDPEEIAEMFIQGAEKAGMKLGEDLLVELDRKKAIKKALEMAKAGDMVLILGKGHEKTILRADGPHPFEDLVVTRQLLEKMMKKKK